MSNVTTRKIIRAKRTLKKKEQHHEEQVSSTSDVITWKDYRNAPPGIPGSATKNLWDKQPIVSLIPHGISAAVVASPKVRTRSGDLPGESISEKSCVGNGKSKKKNKSVEDKGRNRKFELQNTSEIVLYESPENLNFSKQETKKNVKKTKKKSKKKSTTPNKRRTFEIEEFSENNDNVEVKKRTSSDLDRKTEDFDGKTEDFETKVANFVKLEKTRVSQRIEFFENSARLSCGDVREELPTKKRDTFEFDKNKRGTVKIGTLDVETSARESNKCETIELETNSTFDFEKNDRKSNKRDTFEFVNNSDSKSNKNDTTFDFESQSPKKSKKRGTFELKDNSVDKLEKSTKRDTFDFEKSPIGTKKRPTFELEDTSSVNLEKSTKTDTFDFETNAKLKNKLVVPKETKNKPRKEISTDSESDDVFSPEPKIAFAKILHVPKINDRFSGNIIKKSSSTPRITSKAVASKEKSDRILREIRHKLNFKPAKRTAMPDFNRIHKAVFDQDEDIVEYSNRKKARAELLLSGNKAIDLKTTSFNSNKSGKYKKQLKFATSLDERNSLSEAVENLLENNMNFSLGKTAKFNNNITSPGVGKVFPKTPGRSRLREATPIRLTSGAVNVTKSAKKSPKETPSKSGKLAKHKELNTPRKLSLRLERLATPRSNRSFQKDAKNDSMQQSNAKLATPLTNKNLLRKETIDLRQSSSSKVERVVVATPRSTRNLHKPEPKSYSAMDLRQTSVNIERLPTPRSNRKDAATNKVDFPQCSVSIERLATPSRAINKQSPKQVVAKAIINKLPPRSRIPLAKARSEPCVNNNNILSDDDLLTLPKEVTKNRFGFKLNNNKEDITKAVMQKTRVVDKRSVKETGRTIIKGVRSNRRFDLLMEMRLKK